LAWSSPTANSTLPVNDGQAVVTAASMPPPFGRIRHPLYHKSAFKHDVTEADVRWAFKTFVFEEPIEGEEGKYLLIGYDLTGNPLEILFHEVGENAYYVFHAMKCRKQLREIADI
jgi:hypothetical protein